MWYFSHVAFILAEWGSLSSVEVANYKGDNMG